MKRLPGLPLSHRNARRGNRWLAPPRPRMTCGSACWAMPVRIHPMFWVVIGGAGLAGSQSCRWSHSGWLAFRFDPGSRVRTRLDGEECSAARHRSSSGDWAGCATARRNAKRRDSGWPSSERARRRVRALFRGDARCVTSLLSASRPANISSSILSLIGLAHFRAAWSTNSRTAPQQVRGRSFWSRLTII